MSDSATAALDAEPELIPLHSAFERYFQKPLLVEVDDQPARGLKLTFPPVFRPVELVGGVGHFKHNPEMVRHVRALNFDWGDDGRILTAPSPHSFNALVDAIVGPDAGWRLEYVVENSTTMALGPFLTRYLAGSIPVHVAEPSYYDAALGDGPSSWMARALEFQLVSLAHDLTVHALNYHLVPRRAIERIRAMVTDAIPERVEGWSSPGAVVPLTIGFFLDNDLNRFCMAVWCRCTSPDRFEGIFEANVGQLERVLEVRLDETLAGKGDVASGDTRDMQPLETIEFRIP